MCAKFILHFNPEVTYSELLAENTIVLKCRERQLTFNNSAPGLNSALNTLKCDRGATKKELNQIVQQADGLSGLFLFNSYLKKLINLGWISHGIDSWATAIPLSEDYQFVIPQIDWQEQIFSLSRFAYLHTIKGQMVLSSPLSKAQISLWDCQVVALIAKLAQAQTYQSLLSEFPQLTEAKIKLFLSLLLGTKMLEDNSHASEENISLAQWEFHDLLFHSCSRQGRHNKPVGTTYRFQGQIKPTPALKKLTSSKTIQLFKPDLQRLKDNDLSLTEAIESRKSLRNYNALPIDSQQLGEFLYRTARVRQVTKLEEQEYTSRPYPNGGALYELELYPIINTCQGIESGAYYYDPLAHQLCQLCKPNEHTAKLIKDAWYAAGKQNKPQIIIAIAARFSRVSWKYQSIAYSLILKHVGVLYQTMYLVATAMNLAPSALGSGNSDLFTKIVGTNYYTESSVGEFILGSKQKLH